MKIQREAVLVEPGRSFRRFTPSLRHYFYWHYHPEYELVYVEATAGIRHVGQHISRYIESDLVLIGPNIPHLNFDYGLETEYHQIVVQLRENFLGDALRHTPEFESIDKLFQRASYGISFSGRTKALVADKLKSMEALGHFEQLLCLIEAFRLLSLSEEGVELNDRDTSVKLFLNDKIRMGAVYKYIHAHYNDNPDVNAVAASVHLSTAAFCRYFRRQTNMTFTDFVNQYRITQAQTLLLQEKTISETCFEVGFESLSYFNRLYKKLTGENPGDFRKRIRAGKM